MADRMSAEEHAKEMVQGLINIGLVGDNHQKVREILEVAFANDIRLARAQGFREGIEAAAKEMETFTDGRTNYIRATAIRALNPPQDNQGER